jgi:hypothetical protein
MIAPVPSVLNSIVIPDAVRELLALVTDVAVDASGTTTRLVVLEVNEPPPFAIVPTVGATSEPCEPVATENTNGE